MSGGAHRRDPPRAIYYQVMFEGKINAQLSGALSDLLKWLQ